MLHVVEVDQSGKVEDTKEDTVLAFSDGISSSVLIPATVKREWIWQFRQWGITPDRFYLFMFTTGLYFLLKDHIQSLSHLIIDTEYYGKDGQIKRYLINLLLRAGCPVTAEQIHFGYIGKSSSAHQLAWGVLRGKQKAARILTFDEVVQEFHQ